MLVLLGGGLEPLSGGEGYRDYQIRRPPPSDEKACYGPSEAYAPYAAYNNVSILAVIQQIAY